MISVKHLLKKYSELLNNSWEIVENLNTVDLTGSFKIDWLQANWELTVERLLFDPKSENTLEPYGDGADCNGASSRVLYPDRIPNYQLICTAYENALIYDYLNEGVIDLSNGDLLFDRFVTLGEDGWYYESSPFDKVLGDFNGKEVVVDFDKLEIAFFKLN